MFLEKHWNRFWFRPAPYLALALFRVVLIGYQLKVLFSRNYLSKLTGTVEISDVFYQPLPVIELLLLPFGSARPSELVLQILFWITVVAGGAALLGVGARAACALFAVLNVFVRGYLWSFGEWHHPECPLLLLLCFLPFTPFDKPRGAFSVAAALLRAFRRQSAEVLKWVNSSREDAGWFLKLSQVLLAIAYFSAGLEKLRNGGLEWMNGYTLRHYLISYGWMYREIPESLELAGYLNLLVILSVGAVFWELTFPVVLFCRRLILPYLLCGGLMHYLNYQLLNVNFSDFVVLYIAFLLPPLITWSGHRSGGAKEESQ